MSQESKKRFHCGHCNEFVCKTVYFQHKRLHFDKEKNEWSTAGRFFNNAASSQPSLRPSLRSDTRTSLPEATATLSCQESTQAMDSDDGPLEEPESDLHCSEV